MQGILDGNGMHMTGITLTGAFAEEQEAVGSSDTLSKKEEFGLFARLDGAVVKNLKLSFNEVSATEFSVVGSLAGVAVDSLILGIDNLSETTVVQGKNIVGGLIGLVIGDSQVQNITSNISARSTYRNAQNLDNAKLHTATINIVDGEEVVTDYTLTKIYSLQSKYFNKGDNLFSAIRNYKDIISKGELKGKLPNTNVSYAGGIVGECTGKESTNTASSRTESSGSESSVTSTISTISDGLSSS